MWIFILNSTNIQNSFFFNSPNGSSSLEQTRHADVKPFEEKVKERRRGTAESLKLFLNDWFDLIVCVDLFTHQTYIL